MSGFEVAGIVLGLIPMVIKATTSYADGLSTLQRWRKYDREIQSLNRNLETERARLKNVCEKLLLGLVPHSQIESMIDDEGGSLWREDAIQKKMKSRLWECFDVFEANIVHVREALDEINRKIEMQNGSGNVLDLNRAKFTLTRASYRELLTTIKDGISTLENLIDRNIELEPERKVRSQGKILGLLRDISQSLYRSLRSSLDSACKHDLGLKLRRQSAHMTPADGEKHILKELEFHIALSHNSISSGTSSDQRPSTVWKELLVKAEIKPDLLCLPGFEKSISARSRPRTGKRKSVRFAASWRTQTSSTSPLVKTQIQASFNKTMSDDNILSSNTSKSISDLAAGVASIGFAGFGATADLCEKLKGGHQPGHSESYGSILDPLSHTTRRYTISPRTTLDDLNAEFGQKVSIISLREILEKKCSDPPLSYRDRLQLGTLISYSILHLHGTSWVPETFRSDNIFFIKSQDYPDYTHPFVIKNFPEDVAGISPTKSNLPFGRNPVLFSLGIILIELHMGRSFESMRETDAEDSLTHGAIVDYITAQRALEQLRRASPNYYTAVSRCIDGELHTRSTGLDDKDFCHDVYSGVVAVLDRDLENT